MKLKFLKSQMSHSLNVFDSKVSEKINLPFFGWEANTIMKKVMTFMTFKEDSLDIMRANYILDLS